MEEPQYRGIANCASDFADGVNSRRTVYAKPVFAQEALTPEQLPLEEIYNHPDFVDLICAQEFGLEYSAEAGVLVCIAVTATAEALDEIERMWRNIPLAHTAPRERGNFRWSARRAHTLKR